MLSYSPSTGVHVECVCPHSCDDDVSAAAHFSGRSEADAVFDKDMLWYAAVAILAFLLVWRWPAQSKSEELTLAVIFVLFLWAACLASSTTPRWPFPV
jgi:cell division protein FtsW (lipid II flippase)